MNQRTQVIISWVWLADLLQRTWIIWAGHKACTLNSLGTNYFLTKTEQSKHVQAPYWTRSDFLAKRSTPESMKVNLVWVLLAKPTALYSLLPRWIKASHGLAFVITLRGWEEVIPTYRHLNTKVTHFQVWSNLRPQIDQCWWVLLFSGRKVKQRSKSCLPYSCVLYIISAHSH